MQSWEVIMQLGFKLEEEDLCQSWKRNCPRRRKSCTSELLLLGYVKMLCPSFSSVRVEHPLGMCHAIRYNGSLWVWGWAPWCGGWKLGKKVLVLFQALWVWAMHTPSFSSNVTLSESWPPENLMNVMACCGEMHTHTLPLPTQAPAAHWVQNLYRSW